MRSTLLAVFGATAMVGSVAADRALRGESTCARGDNCCYEYDVEWAGADCNADCVALSSGMLGEMFCWALMRRKPGGESPGSPKATSGR